MASNGTRPYGRIRSLLSACATACCLAEREARVVEVVQRELLTPLGLRTLSPANPAYRPRYEGGVAERDSAYHQGTVWPWLMGHFLSAYLKVHRRSKPAKAQAREWLQPFAAHLTSAGLGQISEIADGDPPHTPRGCIAQAWSVAEILRAALETGEFSQVCPRKADN